MLLVVFDTVIPYSVMMGIWGGGGVEGGGGGNYPHTRHKNHREVWGLFIMLNPVPDSRTNTSYGSRLRYVWQGGMAFDGLNVKSRVEVSWHDEVRWGIVEGC